MAEQVTDEDLQLLEELGVETAPAAAGGRTAREQRIIAGFEEIQRFVAEHGRPPQHGESGDIFERLYAVRLDRIRASAECRAALKGLDTGGLLGPEIAAAAPAAEPTDDELLASLGVESAPESDVTKLVHVRSREEIRAAEEVAQRKPCADFAEFKPLFEQVQQDLDSGVRRTAPYQGDAKIEQGDLLILEGQKLLIAHAGERFVPPDGRPNRKLRVVYDNGTESIDMLMRSLQRALNRDKSSRRITEPGPGPLFSSVEEEGDVDAGRIYVLRSKSDDPFIAEHRKIIHKIGGTRGEVKKRVAGAKKAPTYLLSEVEEVAAYKLANMSRKRLESLLHKFFAPGRLDVHFKDRFGSEVAPREWFVVPVEVIDEAIDKIRDGSIGEYRYDPGTLKIVPVA